TNFLLGEIRYSGGDGIAFDPHNSRDWENVCRDVARCLELLILREYLVTQQSLLAVGRMQALLAHEMKNPLAVIKVCAGILQDRLHGDEDSEECLRTIDSEVNRVSHAVQKVFTHSSSHEKRARTELCHLIQTLRQMALARFPDRQIQLQFKSEEGIADNFESLKIWVWIEPEAFQQCLMNLVVNAFEAASPEVTLTVELEKEKRLRLIVQDRGSGIAPGVELFKPFLSTKAFGTGLGLSQVKSCVERHLGRIYVKSKEGRGSSFYLDFPSSIFVKQEEWVSGSADFMESFEGIK
ncbi:MAG: sensor histidine kinase, partial [Bdellovibrionota bacterium]